MINSCYAFQMQKTNYTTTFGLRSAEFLWLQGIRTDMCISAAWQHHRFSKAHTPIRRLLVLFASSSLAVRSWRARKAPLVRAIFDQLMKQLEYQPVEPETNARSSLSADDQDGPSNPQKSFAIARVQMCA